MIGRRLFSPFVFFCKTGISCVYSFGKGQIGINQAIKTYPKVYTKGGNAVVPNNLPFSIIPQPKDFVGEIGKRSTQQKYSPATQISFV